MYQYYFFDLDGTLTDPGEGITNSVAYALKHFGIEEPDHTKLYPFIGPPLIDSFRKYYGFSEQQADEAVEKYREYFRERGLYENKLYEDIPSVLRRLKESGKTLAVATSKPEIFTEKILQHFDLRQYFDFVGGATLDKTRIRKSDVIAYVIESLGIRDKSQILMIGDRDQDVYGAKANGIACAGVLYGYGSREELENAGADYVVEKPQQLLYIRQPTHSAGGEK